MQDSTAKPADSGQFVAVGTDALFEQVYDRLKAMAGQRIAVGARGTLNTTALVHDLYLRLTANTDLAFTNPAQFYCYAAKAMRHLLSDRARHRLRQRAGGGWIQVTLTGADHEVALDSAEQAMSLDQTLDRLEQVDARAAQVVELVYFAGLSHAQTAEMLGLTARTIDRDWRFARAFLKAELGA